MGRTSTARRLGAVLALAVAAGAVGGCIGFIMRGDVVRQDAGWTITLEALKDGPNSLQTGGDGTYAVPPKGLRFLWAWVKIRNDLNATRVFGYDSCDMDLDDDAVLPSIVGWLFGTIDERRRAMRPARRATAASSSYPNGRLPTRIRCGNTIFDVPGRPPTRQASR